MLKLDGNFNVLRCTFKDERVEREYVDFMDENASRYDGLALIFGLLFYAAYGFMDLAALSLPGQALSIRIFAVVTAIFSLLLVRWKLLPISFDNLIPILATYLGLALCAIIAFEPTRSHNYFVGLIQVIVFVSFILRSKFVLTGGCIMITLLGYIAAVITTTGSFAGADALKAAYVVAISMCCLAGVYIQEINRRQLFQQNRVIEQQRAQVSALLDVARDNLRAKTALLRVFTHRVNNPLHQVAGYLDLIKAQFEPTEDETESKQSTETAEYCRYAIEAQGEVEYATRYLRNLLILESLTEEECAQEPLNIRHFTDDSFVELEVENEIDSSVYILESSKILDIAFTSLVAGGKESNIAPIAANAELAEGRVNLSLRFDAIDAEKPHLFSHLVTLNDVTNFDFDRAHPSLGFRIAGVAFKKMGVAVSVDVEGGTITLDWPQLHRFRNEAA